MTHNTICAQIDFFNYANSIHTVKFWCPLGGIFPCSRESWAGLWQLLMYFIMPQRRDNYHGNMTHGTAHTVCGYIALWKNAMKTITAVNDASSSARRVTVSLRGDNVITSIEQSTAYMHLRCVFKNGLQPAVCMNISSRVKCIPWLKKLPSTWLMELPLVAIHCIVYV